MKLLILTQAVDRNDPILGFFHRWIEEFAKHVECLTVICLREGEHDLPKSVRVLSLGKESSVSRFVYAMRFVKYIVRERADYDAVFVHMNPEYVLLGSVLWRLMRKRVVLWYVHKSITWKLRFAVYFVHRVLTAVPQSIRLVSPKIVALGHGVDIHQFKLGTYARADRIRILTVGRISRSKGIDTMLHTLDVLDEKRIPFDFTIIGAPVTEADRAYEKELMHSIQTRPYAPHVHMPGAVRHKALANVFKSADIFLNISSTGGLDKTILESLLSGVPVISSNETARPLLESYGLFVEAKPDAIAARIGAFLERQDIPSVRGHLRDKVAAQHSLQQLIPRIVGLLSL